MIILIVRIQCNSILNLTSDNLTYAWQQSQTQKMSMPLYMASLSLSFSLGPSSSSAAAALRYWLNFLEVRREGWSAEPREAAWLMMSLSTRTSEMCHVSETKTYALPGLPLLDAASGNIETSVRVRVLHVWRMLSFDARVWT